MIRMRCQCGTQLTVPLSFVGRAAKCSACKHVLRYATGSGAINEAEGSQVDSRLVITSGPQRAGEQILLVGSAPIGIGKSAEQPVALPGNHLSHRHCVLIRTQIGWRVEDQNSRNGLFVNGNRVATHELQEGDELQIGEYELKFLTSASGLASVVGAVRGAESAKRAAQLAAAADAGDLPLRPDVENLPKAAPIAAFQPVAPIRMLQKESAGEELIWLSDEEPSRSAPVKANPGNDNDFDLYDFAEQPVQPKPRRTAPPPIPDYHAPPPLPAMAPVPAADGPTCPSCGLTLARGAKICIACAIDIKTGRPLVTSHGVDEDSLVERTRLVSWFLSWIFWFMVMPLASEAYGGRKPYAVWTIAILTSLISIPLFYFEESPAARNLMLWTGKQTPAAIERQYLILDLRAALQRKQNEEDGGAILRRASAIHAAADDNDDSSEDQEPALPSPSLLGLEPGEHPDPQSAAYFAKKAELKGTVPDNQLVTAAYNALPESDRCFGEFHWYQLITHAFLHGGYLHLIGNLIFLLIFGGRVNALIGDFRTVLIYPVLAAISGYSHAFMSAHAAPMPELGASGAIMGLAGMYLIFFPVQKVFMVIWFRIPLIVYGMKIFRMRGFWMLVMWVTYQDVWPTLRAAISPHGAGSDHVAHWAHLGGFLGGIAIAVGLLIARLVNARGADLLSVSLGRHAWALVGKPTTRKQDEPASLIAARVVDLNYR